MPLLRVGKFVIKIQRRSSANLSGAQPGCWRSQRFYFSHKFMKLKNISLFCAPV